jgi:hypothetical protein
VTTRWTTAEEAARWRAGMRRVCHAAGLRVRTGASQSQGGTVAWRVHADHVVTAAQAEAASRAIEAALDHIFPKIWCERRKIRPQKYSSIVNKTPLTARSSTIPAAATCARSPPSWQPRWDSASRSGSLPGRGYEQGQPAAWREQDGEEPTDRDAQQSAARVTGQNGRGSAKRAVLRTARSARTLSAICPWTLLRIDPR